jgi:hypothetical protein
MSYEMTSVIGSFVDYAVESRRSWQRQNLILSNVMYPFPSSVTSGNYSEGLRCPFELVSTTLAPLIWFSSCTDAPTTLKKGLNAVLSLHGNIDSVDLAIRAVTQAINDAILPGDETQELVDGLARTHEHLKTKVETLYSSLNIHAIPLSLRAANPEFVRVLFMARDLKVNIRKRAIGSFFEWDRLDQAVGGRNQALGMCFECLFGNAFILYPSSRHKASPANP